MRSRYARLHSRYHGGDLIDRREMITRSLGGPPPACWSASASPSRQMGSNVKFLMRTRDQYWKRSGLAPDSLTDGPST